MLIETSKQIIVGELNLRETYEPSWWNHPRGDVYMCFYDLVIYASKINIEGAYIHGIFTVCDDGSYLCILEYDAQSVEDIEKSRIGMTCINCITGKTIRCFAPQACSGICLHQIKNGILYYSRSFGSTVNYEYELDIAKLLEEG